MFSWLMLPSGSFLTFTWTQLLVLIVFAASANGQTTSTAPAAYPLVVRSPYFNAWVQTTSTINSTIGNWPRMWNGHILGWSGFVRVDGYTSDWQGAAAGWPRAVAVASYLTPTRTIFTMEAGNGTTGKIQFNVTYLSPVEPSDWVRQSFPFSYVSVDGVRSMDGQAHFVEFEMDTTGEWLASVQSTLMQWNTTQTSSTVYHQMTLATPQLMVDQDDMALDGTLYLGVPLQTTNTTWQIGGYYTTHNQFNTSGSLDGSQETHQSQATNSIVMGFSTSLGNIVTYDSPLVWAIGFVRNPAIRDLTQGTPVFRYSYFWSQYSTIGDGIDAFISDFNQTTARAVALDASLMANASSVSVEYADLVALSLRQTFGSMDITVPKFKNGSYDLSDVRVYMKDIGNSRRINPVETLYASLPAFLYLNSTLARALLSPLLEFQASGKYPNLYAAPDLGFTYPDVSGNTSNTVPLSVENCGSMLVMVLAHAQKSGDGSLMMQYFSLLRSWADYLVTNTMTSSGFVSSDGLNGPNSNLALKGILGLYAMSAIYQDLQPKGASVSDTAYYLERSHTYLQQWKTLATSGDHIVSTYGNESSWGLLYNFYIDKLLESAFLDGTTLSNQTVFYTKQVSAALRYGISLDSSAQNIARSDWTLFTAATARDNTTRDSMITLVHSQAFLPSTGYPWATKYDPSSAQIWGGRASAAQGAMFSLLALRLSTLPINVSGAFQVPGSRTTKKSEVGAIVGGVIGGLAFLGLIVVAFLLYRRRKIKLAEKGEAMIHEPFDPEMLVAGENNSRPDPLPYSDIPNPSPVSIPQPLPFGIQSGMSKRPIPGAPTSLLSSSRNTEGPPSSHNPPSSSGDGTVLRNEVEELRREMALLREAQQRQMEPPPMYADQL